MLWSLCAASESFLAGLDGSRAYFYGGLNTPKTVEQLTDSSQVQAKPGHVYNLQKSLNGIKQAGEIRGSLLDMQLKYGRFKSSECFNIIYFYVTDS